MNARLFWRICAAATLSASVDAQSSGLRVEVVGVTAAEHRIAAQTVRDLDGDGAVELIVVSPDGIVDVLTLAEDGALRARHPEPLRLGRPDSSLLALADVTGGPGVDLVVLSMEGVHAHAYDAATGFSAEPVPLTTSGRLGFRTGTPAFADFLRDVNADGALDLIVPRGTECELWLQGADGDGPHFDLSQALPIDFEHSMWTRSDALTARMRNRLQVPALDIADVNGDGRPDLRAEDRSRRRFFLQDEDGRFAKQAIEVDLSIFQDTTPRASVQLGETIVLSDRQQYQSGDLDGDGIPDHVIAHRRKVWSFLASGDGPQFTKAKTRMVAEDVSGLLLLHLDDDDRADLLIFKVDVPSAGDLVVGLVSSIDVPITVLGYLTDENGDFESRASRRRTLTLRSPSLLSLLGQADDLVRRFTEVLTKFRWSTLGDVDGDGSRDLTMIGEDGRTIELWRSPPGAERMERATERWLRDLLFENPDTVFDIDRLLKLVAQVFDTRTSSLTGEREADARGEIPERPGRFVREFVAADLDGDGRSELIVVDDAEKDPGHLEFTVLRWSEPR